MPKFLEIEACPLCGADGSPLGSLPTYVHRWDMVVDSAFGHCDHCDFAWMTNPPDAESLGEYYSSNDQYRREGLTPEEAHHIAAQVDFLDPSPGRHLEIGPDNGAFLQLMRARVGGEFGYSEMNVDAARRLAEKGFTADDGGRYDSATLRHVFEHIVDPVAYLAALAGRADRIFVEVPDYSALGLKRSDRFQLEHVNYFSLTAMHMVAKRAGLVIEKAGFARTAGYSTTPNRVMRIVFAAATDEGGSWASLLAEDTETLGRFSRALKGRVAIYGAGAVTAMLLAANDRASVVAIYDIDEKKQGRSMLGTVVRAPDEIDESEFDTLVLTVVGYEREVRDFLHGRVAPDKIKTLREFLA